MIIDVILANNTIVIALMKYNPVVQVCSYVVDKPDILFLTLTSTFRFV